MSHRHDELQTALQAEKDAVETEHRLYEAMMQHLAQCRASRAIKLRTDLLQEWKASMQERLSLSFFCTGLTRCDWKAVVPTALEAGTLASHQDL